ncbi:hypothetical protein KI440_00070 [Candidatus Saccharibacteria bacterium TM7i]|nr:hypothetical protein KI440_00070 [Candidatus Saccharibacteria bacterium TM7i]
MKKLTLLSTILFTVVATFLAISTPVSAQGSIQQGVEAAHGNGQPTQLFGDAGVITSVTNILLFIVGALAVIMIIWGGIRYAISGGNSSAVTSAKNTIMYALIGLIVAFLAFAMVNFVLSAIAPGGSSGFTNV